MKRKISLAYLTLPGVNPFDQIKIAKDAGYDCVSLRTIPMGQPGEPQPILEKDPELMARIQEALKEYELPLLDIELLRVREDLPDDYRGAFECAARLGTENVLCSVWTEDRTFAAERLAQLAEQAREYGLNVNLEFPAIAGIRTLDDTLEMVDRVGAPNLKILMDMLYVHWDHVDGEKIRSIAPEKFGVIHLCDSPKNERDYKELVEIMRGAREYPGIGAADLQDILSALPKNPCAIELPNLANIEKYGQFGHAKNCLDYARKFFAEHGLD